MNAPWTNGTPATSVVIVIREPEVELIGTFRTMKRALDYLERHLPGDWEREDHEDGDVTLTSENGQTISLLRNEVL